MPTEEEKTKILEAQMANPDLPLGNAEQFLITLASINELVPRLKLWLFHLDYQNLEKVRYLLFWPFEVVADLPVTNVELFALCRKWPSRCWI